MLISKVKISDSTSAKKVSHGRMYKIVVTNFCIQSSRIT
jgi:hypothetical protein